MEAKTKFEFVTHSAAETIEFGRNFAHDCHWPCVVLLEGNLGSGKTTLAKGLVAGLGAASEEDVTSPSFTLVHEYGDDKKVYHADLYRVESPQELASLGLDELFVQPAIVMIEWGEKLGDNVPVPSIRIQMEHLSGEDRKIIVERRGE